MAIIICISLEKELGQRTQKYCKDTGRTVSGLIGILLKKYFEKEESL